MSLTAPFAQAVGDKLTRVEVLAKMVEMQMLGMRPPDQVAPRPASELAHAALRALRSQRRRGVHHR